jgi:hypothetical protein
LKKKLITDLDVAQRRVRCVEVGVVVGGQERLVAHRHPLDVDAALEEELGDVLLDPGGGGGGVAGEGGEQVVGRGDHELDAGAGHGADDVVVRVEDLGLLDAVGLHQLHDVAGRQLVERLRAPVHPQRRDAQNSSTARYRDKKNHESHQRYYHSPHDRPPDPIPPQIPYCTAMWVTASLNSSTDDAD